MARFGTLAWWKQFGLAVATIVLFVVIGVSAAVGLLAVVGPQIRGASLDANHAWFMVVQQLVIVSSFLLATWVVGVLLLKRPWSEWGWQGPAGTPRAFARGTLIGALMATLAIALALAGGATLRVEETVGAYVAAVLPLALALVGAALAEELTFRGLPIRRLADALGPRAATVLLAAAFGLAHLGNPSATFFGTANIVLAGIWLSIAFFSPGGIGLAWGLHFGWNGMLALGFDAPVSGYMMHVPGPEYTIGRHAWFDGGAFGPEGGLVATIALLAGTAYLLRDRRRGAALAAA